MCFSFGFQIFQIFPDSGRDSLSVCPTKYSKKIRESFIWFISTAFIWFISTAFIWFISTAKSEAERPTDNQKPCKRGPCSISNRLQPLPVADCWGAVLQGCPFCPGQPTLQGRKFSHTFNTVRNKQHHHMVARRRNSQHKQSSRESWLRCWLIFRDHRTPCSYVSPYPDIPSFCGRWRKWRAIPQWLRNWDSTVMDLATVVATSWKKLTLFETCHCLPATIISNSIAMTFWQVVSQEPALPTGFFFGRWYDLEHATVRTQQMETRWFHGLLYRIPSMMPACGLLAGGPANMCKDASTVICPKMLLR